MLDFLVASDLDRDQALVRLFHERPDAFFRFVNYCQRRAQSWYVWGIQNQGTSSLPFPPRPTAPPPPPRPSVPPPPVSAPPSSAVPPPPVSPPPSRAVPPLRAPSNSTSNSTVPAADEKNTAGPVDLSALERAQGDLAFRRRLMQNAVVSHWRPPVPAVTWPDFDAGTLQALTTRLRQTRLLITSTQRPGFGGSATNCYNIAKFLRKHTSLKVALVFFEAADFVHNLKCFDPEGIGGVFRLPRYAKITSGRYKERQIMVQKRRDVRRMVSTLDKYLGGRPQVILSKNYVAPLQVAELYPDVPHAFLVGGSRHATKLLTNLPLLVRTGLQRETLQEYVPEEKKCNGHVDLIVCNSAVCYDTFAYVYPSFGNKLTRFVDTSRCSATDLKEAVQVPWADRRFDVGFVVSSMKRKIKGVDLVRELLPRLKDLRCVTVGDHFQEAGLNLPHVENLRTQANETLLREVMPHVRVLVVPSIWEASPNTVREALDRGVVPVVSNTVGNMQDLPAPLVLDAAGSLDPDAWAASIREVLQDPGRFAALRNEYRAETAHTLYSMLQAVNETMLAGARRLGEPGPVAV